MGGERLPGKVARPIGPYSVLEHVVRRCRHRGYTVIVAACRDGNWDWSNRWRVAVPDNQGADKFVPIYFPDTEPTDLLGRIAETAKYANQMARFLGDEQYGVVLRVTADCPLLPVEAIDRVAEAVASGENDYCESRSDPSSRPNGIDVQACTYRLLHEANAFCHEAGHREHVTGALLAHASRAGRLQQLEGLRLDEVPGFRLTLDTPKDYERLQRIAAHVSLDPTAGRPTLVELKDLHRRMPEVFK